LGATSGFARYDEQGNLAGFQPSNFVMGRGKIERRPVVVGGDDFTVRGGAADAAIAQKQIAAEQMAHELRLPIVRLIEGTGGGGSVKSLETAGFTYIPANPGWNWVVDNLNTVPVVSLGLGPVAGLGAARMVTSHYSLLVEGLAQMFVAGPPVVAAIGEQLTKEELGGARMHAQIGAVDDQVASEQEAFAHARRFLSYLPASVYDLPPRGKQQNDCQRREDSLLEAVPRDRHHVYKMRPIWGSLPIEGGIEAAYKSDLAASADPARLLEEIKERLNRVRSPFRTAEKFGIEEIIDPRDTRPLLCEFANLAAPLRTPGRGAALFRP
jgi:propionyl-CoA carboxylase beta chain